MPEVLMPARFVPRQEPGRREPARVTAGAFRKFGLPVPENPAQLNSYQLSRRQGFDWSPSIDTHVRRRGAELLGCGRFACLDLDTALAVDGSIWQDGMRRLADFAAEAGDVLDLSGCVVVRTPGNGSHGEGWHVWLGRTTPRGQVRSARQVPAGRDQAEGNLSGLAGVHDQVGTRWRTGRASGLDMRPGASPAPVCCHHPVRLGCSGLAQIGRHRRLPARPPRGRSAQPLAFLGQRQLRRDGCGRGT